MDSILESAMSNDLDLLEPGVQADRYHHQVFADYVLVAFPYLVLV